MEGCHVPLPWARDLVPELGDKKGHLRNIASPQLPRSYPSCRKGAKGTNIRTHPFPSLQFSANIYYWLKPGGVGQGEGEGAFVLENVGQLLDHRVA